MSKAAWSHISSPSSTHITHSSLPHGWLSLTTAIVSTIAVSLSLNTLSNCRFVIVQGYGNVVYRGFGLTTYEMYENSCQGYYESWNRGDELPTTAASQLGTMAVTGRVFGIVDSIFGVIAMIISWSVSCIACDTRFVKGMGVSYTCIMIFQGLAFLFFGADLCKNYECMFGSAAGLNIAAVVLWAVASVLSFLTPPFDEVSNDAVLPITARSPDDAPMKNVTEKITEIINTDGTKEIRREVVHPDGSKVIETTKIGKGEVVKKEGEEDDSVEALVDKFIEKEAEDVEMEASQV